ncbi:hypothetical protein SCLCIDRAFT_31332 [Scleroderma citrinum Foug A]|uniref:Uncharacterized protein n=1 Tax=Scleroderma citrinum Foug A TaxID=1036808 RepID=A0A0C3DDL2_9AGAM|nr:hypothetical protein SCLCIDRAFT_31332 [Scleroderma citrinum Foug A]
MFDDSIFTVGRPSEAILDMIQEGLDHINAYLTDLAARSGQPPQQIIDRFLKKHTRLNPTNDWNSYSKYFTQHTEQELVCLWKTGEFAGSIDSTPSATVCKKCYELFKKRYPDTWQGILAKFEESVQYTEMGKTFGHWQQLFNRSVKQFTQLFAALLKAHSIEAAFVMAGGIVNQDASLGYVYTTPGAEDFFMQRCRADDNAIIGHFKAHIYNQLSLTCVTEVLHTNKSDIKGKGKGKETDRGQDVVDLTSDYDGPVPDNGSDEREDHNLVKKLLSALVESHGQTWADGKLFPWKQLPQKLGQHALICVNWPNAVLFPGQECLSHTKPKGISDLTIPECLQVIAVLRDSGPHKLHFKLDPNSKSDLLASKRPVIIGAPPLHDSESLKVKRIFYNGKVDYEGLAWLLN